MLDVLLALGLLLSPAAQLRLGSAPVGPGEILLTIWTFLMLCREAGRLGPPLTRPLSILLIFWLVFAVAQCLGTMTGFVMSDQHDHSLFLHDVVAYPLLAAVSCLAVVEPAAGGRLHRIAWLVVTLGTVSLALQVGKAWEWINFLPIEPWYWDRLRGWSANPNQLALLCTILWLLSLHLADTTTAFRQRTAAMACSVLPIYVGRLTKSDTFVLVLFASGLIFVTLKFRTWLFVVNRRFSLRSALAWIVVLLLPMVLLASVPISYVVKQEAADVARQMSKDNGEGTEEEARLRFEAWRQAIDRGIESGMLGLGPGPHVPIPPALVAARRTEVEPKFVEHPEVNGTANFEAHNTLLDLFTQCGLIGILSFLWLVVTTVSGTYRARLDGLTTLLCGLALFSVTHLIIRHPIFWFALALCLVASGGIQSTAVAYRRAYDTPIRS